MEDKGLSQTAAEAGVAKPAQKKKKRVLLRLVLWVVIIAAVIVLTLFLSSRIAKFDTIKEMLDWIWRQIG